MVWFLFLYLNQNLDISQQPHPQSSITILWRNLVDPWACQHTRPLLRVLVPLRLLQNYSSSSLGQCAMHKTGTIQLRSQLCRLSYRLLWPMHLTLWPSVIDSERPQWLEPVKSNGTFVGLLKGASCSVSSENVRNVQLYHQKNQPNKGDSWWHLGTLAKSYLAQAVSEPIKSLFALAALADRTNSTTLG